MFTLVGEPTEVESAARRLATASGAAPRPDDHQGAHPRLGVLDVVPFVPFARWPEPLPRVLDQGTMAARNQFAGWLSSTFDIPCFLYGPFSSGEWRTLPEIRRHAFVDLAPDTGPPVPHPTAGATAVGARGLLIAYNLWLQGGDRRLAGRVARELRSPQVRALAFALDAGLQVSCNLVDPTMVGPAEVQRQVNRLLEGSGATIDHCELVGLLPAAVLHEIGRSRWPELGLDEAATIEARLDRPATG